MNGHQRNAVVVIGIVAILVGEQRHLLQEVHQIDFVGITFLLSRGHEILQAVEQLLQVVLPVERFLVFRREDVGADTRFFDDCRAQFVGIFFGYLRHE